MKFFFYPEDENQFKKEAKNNFVRTIVFDTSKNEVVAVFFRSVKKVWEQTCKNNIETDHRIKALSGDHFQIYSWVSIAKNDFSPPCFVIKN